MVDKMEGTGTRVDFNNIDPDFVSIRNNTLDNFEIGAERQKNARRKRKEIKFDPTEIGMERHYEDSGAEDVLDDFLSKREKIGFEELMEKKFTEPGLVTEEYAEGLGKNQEQVWGSFYRGKIREKMEEIDFDLNEQTKKISELTEFFIGKGIEDGLNILETTRKELAAKYEIANVQQINKLIPAGGLDLIGIITNDCEVFIQNTEDGAMTLIDSLVLDGGNVKNPTEMYALIVQVNRYLSTRGEEKLNFLKTNGLLERYLKEGEASVLQSLDDESEVDANRNNEKLEEFKRLFTEEKFISTGEKTLENYSDKFEGMEDSEEPVIIADKQKIEEYEYDLLGNILDYCKDRTKRENPYSMLKKINVAPDLFESIKKSKGIRSLEGSLEEKREIFEERIGKAIGLVELKIKGELIEYQKKHFKEESLTRWKIDIDGLRRRREIWQNEKREFKKITDEIMVKEKGIIRFPELKVNIKKISRDEGDGLEIQISDDNKIVEQVNKKKEELDKMLKEMQRLTKPKKFLWWKLPRTEGRRRIIEEEKEREKGIQTAFAGAQKKLNFETKNGLLPKKLLELIDISKWDSLIGGERKLRVLDLVVQAEEKIKLGPFETEEFWVLNHSDEDEKKQKKLDDSLNSLLQAA